MHPLMTLSAEGARRPKMALSELTRLGVAMSATDPKPTGVLSLAAMPAARVMTWEIKGE